MSFVVVSTLRKSLRETLVSKPKDSNLTAARLRELLHYDHETGLFRYRSSRKGIKFGQSVGHNDNGYIRIKVDHCRHAAHRLAWLYVHGEWPNGLVDHANGNSLDNRICNLRVATDAQSAANTGKKSGNKSGVKGVNWKKQQGKWCARITLDYKRTHLGYFDTLDEAREAYEAAAIKHHGEFARFD
jgi:hypothetical protein